MKPLLLCALLLSLPPSVMAEGCHSNYSDCHSNISSSRAPAHPALNLKAGQTVTSREQAIRH
jgi:hypothetical protein